MIFRSFALYAAYDKLSKRSPGLRHVALHSSSYFRTSTSRLMLHINYNCYLILIICTHSIGNLASAYQNGETKKIWKQRSMVLLVFFGEFGGKWETESLKNFPLPSLIYSG